MRHSRLRDLATRLDGVLDHLTELDKDKADSTSIDPSSTSGPTDLPGPTRNVSYEDASTTVSSSSDWPTRLGLNPWLLAHLLQRYRTMQHYFPFVVVLSSWDVPHMLNHRPTLFLAVVASAACHYPVVQQALNEELKETLAQRVLVSGETSLELLQAVLVYLAWWVEIIDDVQSCLQSLTSFQVSILPCTTKPAHTQISSDCREYDCGFGHRPECSRLP